MTETRKPLPLFIGKESTRRYHGVHRFTLNDTSVTGLSAQNWSGLESLLDQTAQLDQIVVTPELITVAGQGLDTVPNSKELVQSRVEFIKSLSKKHPSSMILLGTPTYPPEGKPNNSILFIRNGEVIGQTNKRSSPVDAEHYNLNLVPEEPPSLIPGTDISVLICADLATCSIYGPNQLTNTVEHNKLLKFTKRNNMIGTNPKFLHPEATKLIVASCWGVGGNREWMDGMDPDLVYMNSFLLRSSSIFESYPQIDEILMIDRAPLASPEDQPYVTTRPITAHLAREQTPNKSLTAAQYSIGRLDK